MLVLAGCGSGQKKAEQFTALPFPDVIPPAMMSDEKERAEYLVLHWWDRIADPAREYPCDTTFVSGVKKDDVEQKFANWSNFLGMIEFSAASKAVNRLYDRAYACEKADTSSNVFETFSHLVWVQNAFGGIRICVCVLIANAVVKLYKKAVVDKLTLTIFLAVALGSYFLDLSPVVFVVVSALAGILLQAKGGAVK